MLIFFYEVENADASIITVIQINNVTLKELRERPNTDANFEKAQAAELKTMESGRLITKSCMVVDKHGEPLLAYFSGHTNQNGKWMGDGIPVRKSLWQYLSPGIYLTYTFIVRPQLWAEKRSTLRNYSASFQVLSRRSRRMGDITQTARTT